MKKIIPNKYLNSALQARKDLSPLVKTGIYRYHFNAHDEFVQWIAMLTEQERLVIKNEVLHYTDEQWERKLPGLKYEGQVKIYEVIDRAIAKIKTIREGVAGLGLVEHLLKDLKENYTITKKQ